MNSSERILINALQAAPDAAGTGRYAFEVAKRLGALRDDVTVLAREDMESAFQLPSGRLILAPSYKNSRQRIMYEQFTLPGIARDFRFVHFLDSACILRKGTPCLMTVHDLSYFALRGTFTLAQGIWKRFAAKKSARSAPLVICSSKHTAGDVEKWLHVPQSKIRVIYPGVSVFEGEPVPPNAHIPDGPFILAVSTLEPRKNFLALYAALAALREQGLRLPLVIAGKPGWKCEAILRAPDVMGISDLVTFAGQCTDAQLKWLYQRARMLVYTSLYEGFGFPPLEAMSYGLPVVASNVSSIPEVCGPAAEYVNPKSLDEISSAIRRVHEDSTLREKLTIAGRTQSAQFSWTRTTAEISAAYEEFEGRKPYLNENGGR